MVNLCAHTPSICDGTFTGTALHITTKASMARYRPSSSSTRNLQSWASTLISFPARSLPRLASSAARRTVPRAQSAHRHRAYRDWPPHAAHLAGTLRQFFEGHAPDRAQPDRPTVCYITTYQCLAMGFCRDRGGMANTNAFTCPIPTLPEGCARNLARTAREECTPTAAEAATATAGASLTIIIVAAAAAVVVVTMALAALWCLCRRKGPAGKDSHKAKAATEKVVAEGPAKNVVLQALDA